MCYACGYFCYRCLGYYSQNEFYIKIGQYKYNERRIFCPKCSKFIKGIFKQKIRQYSFCYAVLNEEKIDFPIVFCDNCDFIFENKTHYECLQCKKVYFFKCEYCIKCRNKTKKIKEIF
ncbi:hypothetical protein EHP00_1363 [Ecytonucleospora hepatopenaei]|uniref:Uncharacterized protein n=1 Tax=Ecytonucleospora hepatopenaei TaxID=646526 RepID=A0A1W0E330_9MICR|nr:hypothetical protein EHP00_1363 [Ecytonucleospora hepatopenaei]